MSPPALLTDTLHEMRLRNLNLFMAMIHTSLAIATIVATNNFNIRAPVFQVVIGLNYTTDHDANIKALRDSNISSMVELFDVNLEPMEGLPIAWLTLWFFVITALAHVGAAILYRNLYMWFLRRKCNPLRWIEYSITASLMWLVLAQAFAFIDVNSLVLSTTMIALTMASGIQCEFAARPHPTEDRWTLPLWHRLTFLLPGILLYGVASLMLCIALLTGVNGKLPDFVLPTILVQLALFESFAVVILWQQFQPPSRWIYGEYVYQWLSLFSKAVLGIVLIINVLIYEDYSCVFDDASC
jgi:hypothetical protein